MGARSAALALAASVLLLAGCATATPIPPGITDAEAEEVVAENLAEQWTSIYHGQAGEMPRVERVAFTTPDTWSSAQVSCLVAAGIDAAEVSGGFSVSGDGSVPEDQIRNSQFTCLAEYPVDPRSLGYLSAPQALYAYDYFTQRLAPCLHLLGYRTPLAPDRLAYAGQLRAGIVWTPYALGAGPPLEATPEQWEIINAKCPPLPATPFASLQPPVAR